MFCHHLLALMLFQTHMAIFHMWKTKGMSEQLSSQNGVDEHQGMANLTRTLSED